MLINAITGNTRSKLVGPKLGLELELEGTLPARKVPYWSVHADGSLRNYNGGSAEYVSEPINSVTMRVALEFLAKVAAETKAKVIPSYRTSSHVHLNVGDLCVQDMIQIIMIYAVFEKSFYRLAGEHRYGNCFCIPLAQSQSFIQDLCAFAHNPTSPNIGNLCREGNKYMSISTYRLCDLGTLEFRIHDGVCFDTLDRVRIWCDIITKIREAAVVYENPMDILRDFSSFGYAGFAQRVFGDLADHLQLDLPEEDMYLGLDVAQTLAFATRWSPKPVYNAVETPDPVYVLEKAKKVTKKKLNNGAAFTVTDVIPMHQAGLVGSLRDNGSQHIISMFDYASKNYIHGSTYWASEIQRPLNVERCVFDARHDSTPFAVGNMAMIVDDNGAEVFVGSALAPKSPIILRKQGTQAVNLYVPTSAPDWLKQFEINNQEIVPGGIEVVYLKVIPVNRHYPLFMGLRKNPAHNFPEELTGKQKFRLLGLMGVKENLICYYSNGLILNDATLADHIRNFLDNVMLRDDLIRTINSTRSLTGFDDLDPIVSGLTIARETLEKLLSNPVTARATNETIYFMKQYADRVVNTGNVWLDNPVVTPFGAIVRPDQFVPPAVGGIPRPARLGRNVGEAQELFVQATDNNNVRLNDQFMDAIRAAVPPRAPEPIPWRVQPAREEDLNDDWGEQEDDTDEEDRDED